MSKLIKPLFYEDIDELIGGLLLKKKKKRKTTFTASQYSTLKKITPQPAKLPKYRAPSLYAPPPAPVLPVYFPPVEYALPARRRKPELPKRRTHAEQLADLGRDVEFKTLRTLTKYQRRIHERLEGKSKAERKRILEEERILKEAPRTLEVSSVSSQVRKEQIARARKEGKLRPLPALIPRVPEEEKGEEYDAPAFLFPPVPPKLPGELALLASVKRPVGRPPKLPAEKAAVKVSPKAGIPVVGFENVGKKLPPEPSKKSAPIETFFTQKGKGKFKNQQRKKRSK